MTVVTIPQKISKDKELVAVPRKEYEIFSKWQKIFKTFKPTTKDIAELKRSRADYKAGRFMTINELKQKLAGRD